MGFLNKIFNIGVVLFVFVNTLVILFSCTSAAERSQLGKESIDYQTEGWLDNQTFQIRTIGSPSSKAKGFVKRRVQSEEAALLGAQKRVLELLVGANMKSASGSQDGESTGIIITKKIKGFLKGGAIIRKSFDSDDNCEIIYRIHAEDLKEKAESLIK